MRNWNVTAFFPEVKPAHASTQSCTVIASGISVAARRGLETLLDSHTLKGKHISTVRVTIVAAGKDKALEMPEGSRR